MTGAVNKYPQKIAGKYYVDHQCIGGDLGRETTPDNFKRNDGGGSFVHNSYGTARNGNTVGTKSNNGTGLIIWKNLTLVSGANQVAVRSHNQTGQEFASNCDWQLNPTKAKSLP